jgi:hypothetical protein
MQGNNSNNEVLKTGSNQKSNIADGPPHVGAEISDLCLKTAHSENISNIPHNKKKSNQNIIQILDRSLSENGREFGSLDSQENSEVSPSDDERNPSLDINLANIKRKKRYTV